MSDPAKTLRACTDEEWERVANLCRLAGCPLPARDTPLIEVAPEAAPRTMDEWRCNMAELLEQPVDPEE